MVGTDFLSIINQTEFRLFILKSEFIFSGIKGVKSCANIDLRRRSLINSAQEIKIAHREFFFKSY